MSEGERRPLIDYERHRKQHEERTRELRAHPENAKIVTRARVRILHDYLKEARVGPFTLQSDEGRPAGEGSAPTPLMYFVTAVGF